MISTCRYTHTLCNIHRVQRDKPNYVFGQPTNSFQVYSYKEHLPSGMPILGSGSLMETLKTFFLLLLFLSLVCVLMLPRNWGGWQRPFQPPPGPFFLFHPPQCLCDVGSVPIDRVDLYLPPTDALTSIYTLTTLSC